MQSLEVISLNIWQILISLCNLLILFLILKRFLYYPVKKVMAQRRTDLDNQYQAAKTAQDEAEASKAAYASKLETAQAEADAVLAAAKKNAEHRSKEIVEDAQQKASELIRRTENEMELEKKKAAAGMKREMADVSAALTEKMLAREMNEQDHHAFVRSFLEELGEEYDRSE